MAGRAIQNLPKLAAKLEQDSETGGRVQKERGSVGEVYPQSRQFSMSSTFDDTVALRSSKSTELKGRFVECTATFSERGFLDALFCVLARYQCLRGANSRGAGSQAAIHEEVMNMLVQHWNVQCECFASPLNAQLPRFCR